jgi:hypothetical protein
MSYSYDESEDHCPPGQILKSGYNRKPYTRLDGTTVRGSFVQPTCIEDRGKPGKGPKLIPVGGDVHLSQYGYSINAPDEVRHRAIREAMYEHPEGGRKVQQHLVAISNLQSSTKYANRFTDDVNYSKKVYSKLKSRGLAGGRDDQPMSRYQREWLTGITGGVVAPSELAHPTTYSVDALSDPNDLTDRLAGEPDGLDLVGYKYEQLAGKRDCDEDGVCTFESFVSKPYYVDGKTIVFSTMSLGDPEIKNYFDANKLDIDILSTGPNQKGLLVMKLDDKIVAYCIYKPVSNNAVELMEIHVSPGVRGAFFKFIHEFFKVNGYVAIHKKIDLDNPNAKYLIEFFAGRGYNVVKIKGSDSNVDKIIYLSKRL